MVDNGVTALYAVLDQTFGRTLNYNTKPNATKHGKKDLWHMANIGRRCTIEVAEKCILEQNRPPNRFLASAVAVGPGITYVFDLKVERR